MKTARHIVTFLLSTLLLLCGTSAWAQDAQMDGLHCGDVVVITATPEDGYRFVQWSDGNTDNPREIEIGEDGDVDVYAIFRKACTPQPIIELVQLYDQLVMINVEALQRQNYYPVASDIVWYRIVGEPDNLYDPTDDVLCATGFYIDKTEQPDGTYYAQFWAQDGDEINCADVLRSPTFTIGGTGLHPATDNTLPPQKIIKDEQLLILLKNRVYDARGQQRKPLTK